MRPTVVLLISLIIAAFFAGCSSADNTNTANTNTAADFPTPVAQEIPKFPWPPPRASARAEIPSKILRNLNAPTYLRDVSEKLKEVLDETGYGERSWYSVPEGFALVTQLEQFNPDGTPIDGPDRWAEKIRPTQILNFNDYIKALFTAKPGRYRVIAFVITDQPVTPSDKSLTRDEAKVMVSAGAGGLPPAIGDREFSNNHNCTALVYEFEQTAENYPVIFKLPSQLTGRTHLEKSKILTALAR